ncbi:MAG: glycosyltransferase family 4 protein [Peptococcia bacterium]|jgi:glycosyltransferase involved in cell wall biosynthesis
MKKNIWIWNHYATGTFYNKGGRHYWFAENLIKNGYKPTIFCGNTQHNSDNIINISKGKYITKTVANIPYVFVKTVAYKGNGFQRIKNIYTFYKNLFLVAKEYAQKYGKPDVILASSVHPLTLVAGIKIAKKFGVPCICEVRDLWPESLVAYGFLKRNSLIAKLLYQGEKWIYKRADKLIFTMEGGKDYIIDQGWDKGSGGPVDLDKVYHINNGVDLEVFDYNRKYNLFEDDDINKEDFFKVIYAGSIRKANNLDLIINAAKYLNEKKDRDIKFIIFGDGSEREILENKCIVENISNVIFKGKVNKKYIPYIVSKSNLNILNYSYHDIWKYGGSQNKSFEYFASGRPVLSTISMGYDIIKKFGAGISLSDQSAESIGEAIIKIKNLNRDEYKTMCNNARKAAQEYDYKVLTKRLISIIEDV